jgi:hypothetical protein
MAEPQTASKSNWRAADLLDLDFLLQMDAEVEEAGLASRDEKIAREHLLPVLGAGAMVGDAPLPVRSQGIWEWLKVSRAAAAKSGSSGIPLMPGEVFCQVRPLVGVLGGIVMLALGAGLVFSLLHQEARYFNVMMFLAATLLPQLVLLFLLAGGWVVRGLGGRKSTSGGVAQTLVREIMVWVAGKVRSHRGGVKLQEQWQALKQRNYLAWPVLEMTQTLALMYNMGILAGFAGCLLAMDVRFFWESTPGVAAVETLEQIVRIVSSPWGSLIHDWLPTGEGIAATRITMAGAEKVYPPADAVNSAAVWVPFLTGAVVFWGLLPRLLLRVGVGIWASRALRRYSFVERRHRELWRRLTALRVGTSSSGPDDEAVVLLWGGLNPPPDELRKVLLQQLRLNPVQSFVAGNVTDVSVDAKILREVGETLADMKPGVRLVVAVESWALAPREATDFLNELRERVGQDRAVRLLLFGPPLEERPFSEPPLVEIGMWENLVAARKDAALTVYPYRKSNG